MEKQELLVSAGTDLEKKQPENTIDFSAISLEITEILNTACLTLSGIKQESLRKSDIDIVTDPMGVEIANTIRDTIKRIIALLEINKIENPSAFIAPLLGHEFYDLSIGSADSARHALEKPYGYAGDMHLMKKSCEKHNPGDNYERLTNLGFLDFPTAESIRQRAKSLYETLKRLPEGSKVLNLACGPALEVQGFLQNFDKKVDFTLLDNDPQTLNYLHQQELDDRVTIKEANAFKLSTQRLANLLDGAKMDLAYTSGLFDYIPAKFAPRITQAMFEQLKVGGKLIIGNYLKLSDTNPHPQRQKFVMEEILDWKLIYRSPDEIRGFLSKLDPETYKYHISTEFFATNPNTPTGSIGFLIVEKLR
ncbi:MAG: class I SAM-dependent methyltransferase [Candidatus Gracilibacteria bacterium]|nr:class I SAM-dependent methyltransferase [Candidatus Gracilibacteria bacterium]